MGVDCMIVAHTEPPIWMMLDRMHVFGYDSEGRQYPAKEMIELLSRVVPFGMIPKCEPGRESYCEYWRGQAVMFARLMEHLHGPKVLVSIEDEEWDYLHSIAAPATAGDETTPEIKMFTALCPACKNRSLQVAVSGGGSYETEFGTAFWFEGEGKCFECGWSSRYSDRATSAPTTSVLPPESPGA
jgi:hypothetical protein